MKSLKSPGTNEITNELLNYGGSKTRSGMTILFKKIAKQQKVPTAAQRSYIQIEQKNHRLKTIAESLD